MFAYVIFQESVKKNFKKFKLDVKRTVFICIQEKPRIR